MTAAFFDTNILVYAFGTDERAPRSRDLLANGGTIAVQSLNEFVRVSAGKLRLPWPHVHESLDQIRVLCSPIVVLDLALHEHAIHIAEHYSLRIFDAALLAAALSASCGTFYSEDMHHGLVVEGSLRIVNPFRG